MGPPGAGKGTQAALLATRLGGVHLSSGQLLRGSGEPRLQAIMAAGQLVASADVERLLTGAIRAVPADRPIILDGFVRESSDLAWLEPELTQLDRSITAVINLAIDRPAAVARNLQRGRADDTPAAQAERWRRYAEERPVLEHYRELGLLHEVDGVGTVEAVAERINRIVA